MVDKVNLLDVGTITQDCIVMLAQSHGLKKYQEKFKQSDAQAAQRAALVLLCTQHGPMCICAYDGTSDSADLHPSASLTFAADCTREFLLDCIGTSAQA